jgi:hypothetical protein
VKWQFKGETPLWAKILAGVLFLNILLQVVSSYGIPRWTPIHPDAVHSYAIHYRGGPTFYVQPWIGLYVDYGVYLGFAVLVLFLVLLWINRDQLEQVR